ncbi:uncharacterized protein LOC101854638 isoform X2 [Aplysia californica]|uniref:Uncharacterized protein LOC101854638 isoform X2 n=1 Tax=Aplysia californica TaxID=6500 RepID=A0ABM1VT72_APLCA|nr:uncharacterized protein LOC101854638 isoform X2 [Aplysia californica]
MWARSGDNNAFEESNGGGKKFLYSNPVSSKAQQVEDDQWSFTPKANSNAVTPRGGLPPIDLDNVWSIRNVGLGSGSKSVRSEPSTMKSQSTGKTTSSIYYSRHGGMKGRAGSPRDTLTNGNAPTGSGTNWSSSGHNFGQQTSRKQPPTFQLPSDSSLQDPKQRYKNPSPFARDLNDF